jgi:uracil-DNA glycosylase family 4
VQNVTDRVSNPFGMSIPGAENVVYGYGDVNANIHVIGDHPGVHGGVASGIPFTGTRSSRRLRTVLADVGLIEDPTRTDMTVRSLYLSYLHPSVPDDPPSDADYAAEERFLDAELRAITAHVLVPVGDRVIRHVLETYTADKPPEGPVDALHATELGTGAFLVVPSVSPETWSETEAEALEKRLATILGRDFRRETDLGRFLVGGEPYYVR